MLYIGTFWRTNVGVPVPLWIKNSQPRQARETNTISKLNIRRRRNDVSFTAVHGASNRIESHMQQCSTTYPFPCVFDNFAVHIIIPQLQRAIKNYWHLYPLNSAGCRGWRPPRRNYSLSPLVAVPLVKGANCNFSSWCKSTSVCLGSHPTASRLSMNASVIIMWLKLLQLNCSITLLNFWSESISDEENDYDRQPWENMKHFYNVRETTKRVYNLLANLLF